MDALELLRDDHRHLASLFEKYQAERDRDAKNNIANQIVRELEIHSELEENWFYPLLLKGAVNKEPVSAAFEEHHMAELLMCNMARTQPGSEEFGVELGALKHMVLAHIAMEENVLFDQALAVLGTDRLRELGPELAERKRAIQTQTPKVTITMVRELPVEQRTKR